MIIVITIVTIVVIGIVTVIVTITRRAAAVSREGIPPGTPATADLRRQAA